MQEELQVAAAEVVAAVGLVPVLVEIVGASAVPVAWVGTVAGGVRIVVVQLAVSLH